MVEAEKVDLFRIEGVTKVYGQQFIFKNISFNIKSGEILGIVGKSGSGKTTFLNMLVGLTNPDKGKVLYRNIHLINKDDDDAYRPVVSNNKEFKEMYSFASQKPSFYPNLTAIENLRYFGSLYNIQKKSLEHNANSLLELVDLTSAKDLIAARMSGGMQRRLDVACSLIHDPTVLILDEPTSDLDLVLSNKIWDILRTINQKGTTIIIVSHNIAELEHLCNRLIILKDAKVAAIGSPAEIKSKHLVEESIYIHSKPGNYKKVMSKLGKKVLKNVVNWQINEPTLVVDATNTSDVIKELMKVLEKEKEKIIEIELRKPSLDRIFVQIEENQSKTYLKKSVTKKKKTVAKKKKKKKVAKLKSVKKKTSKKKIVKNKTIKKEDVKKKALKETVIKENEEIKEDKVDKIEKELPPKVINKEEKTTESVEAAVEQKPDIDYFLSTDINKEGDQK